MMSEHYIREPETRQTTYLASNNDFIIRDIHRRRQRRPKGGVIQLLLFLNANGRSHKNTILASFG